MITFCPCSSVTPVNMTFGLLGSTDFLRRDADGESDDLVDFFTCCGVEGGSILVFFTGASSFAYTMINKSSNNTMLNENTLCKSTFRNSLKAVRIKLMFHFL